MNLLGQHEIAIETLVQAISIIKQSPVDQEETSSVCVKYSELCDRKEANEILLLMLSQHGRVT